MTKNGGYTIDAKTTLISVIDEKCLAKITHSHSGSDSMNPNPCVDALAEQQVEFTIDDPLFVSRRERIGTGAAPLLNVVTTGCRP